MKITQDCYESLLSNQVANRYRSGEGESVATNKTIEGPSAYDLRKGHKQDISVYASCNGDCRFCFRAKRNWLTFFLILVSRTFYPRIL